MGREPEVVVKESGKVRKCVTEVCIQEKEGKKEMKPSISLLARGA